MEVSPSTTCLFVSTSPSEVRIIPVPAACSVPPRVTLMSTTPVSCALVAAASACEGAPEPTGPPPGISRPRPYGPFQPAPWEPDAALDASGAAAVGGVVVDAGGAIPDRQSVV